MYAVDRCAAGVAGEIKWYGKGVVEVLQCVFGTPAGFIIRGGGKSEIDIREFIVPGRQRADCSQRDRQVIVAKSNGMAGSLFYGPRPYAPLERGGRKYATATKPMRSI